RDGRLYWNGKPVEIIGQRLDLTRTQAWVAIAVAVFTAIAALGTAVQGWTPIMTGHVKQGGGPSSPARCRPRPQVHANLIHRRSPTATAIASTEVPTQPVSPRRVPIAGLRVPIPDLRGPSAER